MKKLAVIIVITVSLLSFSSTVFAAKREKEVPEENFAYLENDDNYWVKFVANHPDYVFDLVAGKKLGDYKISGFYAHNNTILSHEVYWANPQQIIVPGPQTVQIIAKHDGKDIILSGEIIGIELDEAISAPSLTAATVTLNTLTTYDINLDNKVSGSKYKWTSSDEAVAKVNPKNGLVTAVSEGTAIITCEMVLPDGTTQTLSSVVMVGYDENAPVLTETQLDLEVGDKFDINLENKIAKSKYRWVSSDRTVVKVNSSNGKITAVGPGEAYVTCTITTPDRQVIVLRCDISVTEPTE